MSDNKKCPICAEYINFEAKKCRFCGELFFKEKEKRFLERYKNWLLINHKDILILKEDINLNSLTLEVNQKYSNFNTLIFIFLLLFYIFPGILYLIFVGYRLKREKVIIKFNNEGRVENTSYGKNNYLIVDYNEAFNTKI